MKHFFLATFFLVSNFALGTEQNLQGTWERCTRMGIGGSEKFTFEFKSDQTVMFQTEQFLLPGCKVLGIQGQRAYGHYTLNSSGLTLIYDSLGEGVFYLSKLLRDMAPTYCDRSETVKVGEWTNACKEYFEGSFELGVEFGPYTFELRKNNILFFPEFGDGISETYQRVK